MAAGGLSVERLQEHLQQLSPAARALLVTRLEDAARRGERIPGGEALLHELRGVLRESREPGARRDHVARHFFQAVELFLIDDSAHKRQGRIARASLESLWRWICRDLVPQEAATYSAELGRALTAADSGASQHLTDVFQSLVAERIRSKLDSVQDDHKARRRLIGQIGTLDALDDVRDLRTVLSGRATFALIGTQLPARIRNLADAQLVDVKALLDSPLGGRGELLPQALILVMSRLAAPWQLIRLGVKAAASDDVSRIAKTPYGAAITITLAEIDRMVFELQTRLRRGAGPAANSLLYSIHDGIRGMRTELDFPPGECAPSSTSRRIRHAVRGLRLSEPKSRKCSKLRSNRRRPECAACYGHPRHAKSRPMLFSMPARLLKPKRFSNFLPFVATMQAISPSAK
jgi:hypothetical protein